MNIPRRIQVGGVWCILDIEYSRENEPKNSPWIIESLKPIRISHVDLDFFHEARRAFSVEEWLDLIIQIIRLIPYCENNYVYRVGPLLSRVEAKCHGELRCIHEFVE